MIGLSRLATIWNRGAPQRQPKRGWRCPREGVVAAYLDGALEDAQKARVEKHLAGCAYCRTLVADIVKLRRVSDLPAAPPALVRRARASVRANPRRFGWGWAAATAGALAFSVLAMTVLRTPEATLRPSWPAPRGPLISKSVPTSPAVLPNSELARKPRSTEYLPTIVSPHPNSIVARAHVNFRWNSVPNALRYQVRLVTSEGDLIWEGVSTSTHLEFPEGQALDSGKYFVMVSAVMDNGKMRKSNPVEFQVVSPR